MNRLSTDLAIFGIYFGMVLFMGLLLAHGYNVVGERADARKLAAQQVPADADINNASLMILLNEEADISMELLKIQEPEDVENTGIPFTMVNGSETVEQSPIADSEEGEAIILADYIASPGLSAR